MTASLSRAEFTSRKLHNSELASSTIRNWSLGSTAIGVSAGAGLNPKPLAALAAKGVLVARFNQFERI